MFAFHFTTHPHQMINYNMFARSKAFTKHWHFMETVTLTPNSWKFACNNRNKSRRTIQEKSASSHTLFSGSPLPGRSLWIAFCKTLINTATLNKRKIRRCRFGRPTSRVSERVICKPESKSSGASSLRGVLFRPEKEPTPTKARTTVFCLTRVCAQS